MIGRLLLFALASGCGVLVDSAWGQQPVRIPVVGVLVTHAAVDDPVFDSLRSGLREYGYEDGRNMTLEIVTAAGQLDRLPELAAQLVHEPVDVIVSPNEVSIRAAQKATTTIPIVMMGFGDDPVALGLIKSFRRPGGNVTGLYSLLSESEAKRLEVLKEALPRVSRVAVFWDAFGRRSLDELQRTAPSLAVRIEPIEIRGPDDLDSAFKTAKRKKAGAVMLLWSPVIYVNRERVAALALDARLPTIFPFVPAVRAGALMSYGTDAADIYRRTAYYVDRLLKGAKPAELPVEQVSKFKLAVNLKTAKALGVRLPESILLRADEVIR
ncbi:MAG TPA: ABC transporter substrate-binding protein [Burkholderiales bacterium]|nr:ABC transporter substrate-binding protein [Burkholderiales bacterium]